MVKPVKNSVASPVHSMMVCGEDVGGAVSILHVRPSVVSPAHIPDVNFNVIKWYPAQSVRR